MLRATFFMLLLLCSASAPALAQVGDEIAALNSMILAWPSLSSLPVGAWDAARVDQACTLNWHGLACDVQNHVTSIILETQLAGAIPPEITSLAYLQTLVLKSASLTGEVPNGISSLAKLVTLDLSNNSLTGPAPKIENMVELVTVRISSNRFSGEIFSTSAMVKLSELDASDNSFNGIVPQIVASMQIMDLSKNNFSDLADPFAAGTALRIIDLSANLLAFNASAAFDGLVQLTSLDVSDNLLTSPPLMEGCTSLSELKIAGNGFSGTVPEEYLSLDLEYLDGSRNKFEGAIPDFIGSMRILRLANNKFIGGIPQSFALLEGLEELDLSNNSLGGRIPTGLNSTSLRVLSLGRNQLSGSLPRWIHDFQVLNLTSNQLDLCSTGYLVSATTCDVSRQSISSCGCDAAEIFPRCATDEIAVNCSAIPPFIPCTATPSPASPSSPSSMPSSSPSTPTSPVSPGANPSSPETSSCFTEPPVGFTCQDGVLTYPSSYVGTGDIVFMDPVVIGSDRSADSANFQNGNFTFFSTLTVHGTLYVRADAGFKFRNISQTRRRDLNEPRMTVDNCADFESTVTLSLSSQDISAASTQPIALLQTDCINTPPLFVRVDKPPAECRNITSSPTYTTVRGSTTVYYLNITITNGQCRSTAAPVRSKEPQLWWVGLVVGLVVLALAVLIVLIVIACLPSKKDKNVESMTSVVVASPKIEANEEMMDSLWSTDSTTGEDLDMDADDLSDSALLTSSSKS